MGLQSWERKGLYSLSGSRSMDARCREGHWRRHGVDRVGAGTDKGGGANTIVSSTGIVMGGSEVISGIVGCGREKSVEWVASTLVVAFGLLVEVAHIPAAVVGTPSLVGTRQLQSVAGNTSRVPPNRLAVFPQSSAIVSLGLLVIEDGPVRVG
ncbi:hypothetical protein CRG98_029395 [Punica granatum]|uniref:Uncharacterized protein n=1 Tax=Punica granatum TaxID=22663 RepID=A0A2I0J1U4_PUNGR|nr:hypothetical protein CRG98_029395 [Punica granatum]